MPTTPGTLSRPSFARWLHAQRFRVDATGDLSRYVIAADLRNVTHEELSRQFADEPAALATIRAAVGAWYAPSFADWLRDQAHRDDAVGQLARDHGDRLALTPRGLLRTLNGRSLPEERAATKAARAEYLAQDGAA